MTNYHSDEWIEQRVSEHLYESFESFRWSNIVGIFYQGSGNYGLDYADSDVDTKLIMTPSFKDIALAKKPVSTTHIRKNEEHIDFKDIRLYIETFRKQNLNFLEILFTPYKLLNPYYQSQWQRLVDNREKITHYYPTRSVKSMMGVASEKYFAMEHRYPSRAAWIDKFGYDPKQLHHLLRVEEFLQKYIDGVPYEQCLVSDMPEFLIDVKKGCYNLEKARYVADGTYQNIKAKCDDFVAKHQDETPDKTVDELLDDVSYEIMRLSVSQELNI